MEQAGRMQPKPKPPGSKYVNPYALQNQPTNPLPNPTIGAVGASPFKPDLFPSLI